MEEFLDVLNEKGEYIGKVETREKCHKEGLWHKAVVVFIINSKGQVKEVQIKNCGLICGI